MAAATPYDVTKAFEPIALVGSVKSCDDRARSLGVNTLGRADRAREKGQQAHLRLARHRHEPAYSGAILNHAAGITITHVPYRGLGPALNDIVGGHIDTITTSVIGVLPYVQGGTAGARHL